MKSVHFQLSDPPLPLPFGYSYKTKIDTISDISDSDEHQRQFTQISKNDQTFQNLPQDQQLDMLENKQIIDNPKENSYLRYSLKNSQLAQENDQYNQTTSNHQIDLGFIKFQLEKQIEICKLTQPSGRLYQELLQKLISIIITYQQQNKGINNLIFDSEFNGIIFQIRALPNLDIQHKIQFEQIINCIFKQEEKLQFQELVREITQDNYIYWMEPLYYEAKKRQISQSQWKQFIKSSISLYNI